MESAVCSFHKIANMDLIRGRASGNSKKLRSSTGKVVRGINHETAILSTWHKMYWQFIECWGSSVGTVWLRTGRTGFDPQQRQRIISSSLCVQTSSEAHPASYPMGTGDYFLRVKRGRGVSLPLTPSSAEVKNEELHFLSALAPAWR
jgi:hypothetical protein